MPKMPSNMSENAEPKSAPKRRPRRLRLLEGGVAEAVIGGALVAVLEHLVGLVDLLELVFASLSPGLRSG